MRLSASTSRSAMAGLGAGTAHFTKDTKMSDMPNKKAQLEELKRELKMRQAVYHKWVRAGRLTQEVATHRITCLILVIEDFEARHAPASQQGTLGI